MNVRSVPIACFAALLAAAPLIAGAATAPQRIPVMIVGVAHLVSALDLHNSKKFDPMTPQRQAQIADAMRRLARFKPTIVLVEGLYGSPKLPQEYAAYRAGTFVLGPNEIFQYGFRLAKMSGDETICPIDAQGFPFDYDAVKTSAQQHGQTAILDAADAYTKPFYAHWEQVSYGGTILETLRLLNEPSQLAVSAAWYMYLDRIGSGKDYAGADLVSYWYARNLHIYANIRRCISPGDRVVVFMGAGHVPQLRQYVQLSPDLQFVDPEPYLR